MKKNGGFPFPMRHYERLIGWIYMVFHVLILPFLLDFFLSAAKLSLSPSQSSILYWAIGTAVVVFSMFRYLRESLAELTRNFMDTVRTLIYGFFLYHLLILFCSWLISLIFSGSADTSGAWTELFSAARLNTGVPVIVSVLLAPFVEEVLYRGVVFGCLRKSSRFFAYVVSILIFALSRIWGTLLNGFQWSIFLTVLEYVPAGFILAWCYEKSKNIWGPIVLHSVFNFVVISISFVF